MKVFQFLITEEDIAAIQQTSDHAERWLAKHGWTINPHEGDIQLKHVKNLLVMWKTLEPLK